MSNLYRAKIKDRFNYSEWESMYPDNFKDGYVYGHVIECKNKSFICISVVGASNRTLVNNTIATMVEVNPNTICEYIGITDKKNVKIFENDIVITKYGRKCKVIRFNTNCHTGFDLIPCDYTCDAPDAYDIWSNENLEVVGCDLK